LPLSRTRISEWIGVVIFVPVATLLLREILIHFQGAAPAWDAVTTVLSLAAQYLLCWKRIEHWFVWMTADLIYVPLYLARGLPLIAILYCVFLLMCTVGLVEWIRHYRQLREVARA
jgi:nicotinamide mononucleotide transporter